MLRDKIVGEVPDGGCKDCGIKGQTIIETIDGLRIWECSKCGEEQGVEEIVDDTDYDAMAKDNAIDRNGDY